MTDDELKQKMQELINKQEYENFASNLNRARSITVGTAFGGVTEVMMRSDGGKHVWCLLQPVEVTELIHQLAANIGCHIHVKPRDDFASWRNWRVSNEEKLHLNGHPPHPNDMITSQFVGKELPAIQQQQIPQEKKDDTVAIKKTVNRRKSKSASTTT